MNNPPDDFATLAEDNINKGIVTQKGTKITFVDDEKAAVSIETPQSNKILLDDDAETIDIADQHGNSIAMSSSGITMADKDSNSIAMSSSGIEVKSAGDFKINASGSVEIKGAKVDVK